MPSKVSIKVMISSFTLAGIICLTFYNKFSKIVGSFICIWKEYPLILNKYYINQKVILTRLLPQSLIETSLG